MSDIYTSVLRIASTLPVGNPTRRELLASLQATASKDWQILVDGPHVRIQWQDHPHNNLVIQELPSKPFKAKLKKASYWVWIGQDIPYEGRGALLMVNMIQDMHPSASMTFDQAVAAMNKAVALAVERSIASGTPEKSLTGFKHMPHMELVHYLQVEPSDYKPVVIRGTALYVKSTWQSFTFSEVSENRKYQEMPDFYQSSSPRDSRKLFTLVKAQEETIRKMTVAQFQEMLDKNKIHYKYVPSVYR